MTPKPLARGFAYLLAISLFGSARELGTGCVVLAGIAGAAPAFAYLTGGSREHKSLGVWLIALGAIFATPLVPTILGVDGFYLSVALLHGVLIQLAFRGELRVTPGAANLRIRVSRALLFATGAWVLGSALRGYFAYLPLSPPAWMPGFGDVNALAMGDMTAANHPLMAGFLRFLMVVFAWAGFELTLRARLARGAVTTSEDGAWIPSVGSRLGRSLTWAIVVGFGLSCIEFVVASVWRGDSSVWARLAAGLGRNYRPMLDHNALGTVLVLILPMVLLAALLGVRRTLGRGPEGLGTESASGLQRLWSLVPAVAGVLGVGLLMTSRSKSALAGFGLAIFVFGGAQALQWGGKTKRTFLGLVAAGALLLIGLNFAPDSAIEKLSRSRYGHDLIRIAHLDAASDYIEANRRTVWDYASAVGKQHPLVGVGIGRLPLLMASVHDPELAAPFNPLHENAHSQFVQIETEEGMLGLALFLVLIGMALGGARIRGQGLGQPAEAPWRLAGVAGLAGASLSLAAGHALLLPSAGALFAGMVGWLLAGPSGTPVPSPAAAPSKGAALQPYFAAGLAFAIAFLPLYAPGGRKPQALSATTAGCYPWEFNRGSAPDRARALSDDARWFEVWGAGDVMKIPVRDVRDPRFEGRHQLTLRVTPAFPSSMEVATSTDGNLDAGDGQSVTIEYSLPHNDLADLAADPTAQPNPTGYLKVQAPPGVQPGDLVEMHLTSDKNFNGSRLFSIDHRQIALRMWPPFYQ
ncbi:MAG: hypothetical protein ACI9C2_002331 [Gammaproteobacteria bacterium]|jgi:hypothetical protein